MMSVEEQDIWWIRQITIEIEIIICIWGIFKVLLYYRNTRSHMKGIRKESDQRHLIPTMIEDLYFSWFSIILLCLQFMTLLFWIPPAPMAVFVQGLRKYWENFNTKMHNSVRKQTSKFTKGQTKLMVQIILLCSNVWKV